MNAPANRRQVTRWMLSASLGGLVSPKLNAATTVFNGKARKVNFGPVGSRIQQAIARGNATGVAVAVVHGGRVVWEEGFVWANREAGLKTTPRTPFSLASVTKPFTATTVMTLVAEGKLSLDQPANRFLAGCKLVGTAGNAEALTVRLLGAHASGLPGIYESYEANEARLVPSSNALLQAYGRLAYPPAACYEYSNIGFAALNAIALALTQTEFGALMHRRVLAPLALKDAFSVVILFACKAAPCVTTRLAVLSRTTPHPRLLQASCMRALTISLFSPSSICAIELRAKRRFLASATSMNCSVPSSMVPPVSRPPLAGSRAKPLSGFLSSSRAAGTQESPTGCALFRRKT
jgi:CubicO group peptidase (beta-lactamase class C family)